MADELVERLEKQAHICRTSKTIGLITKARSADAMQHAAARIQSDAAEIEGLQCALSEANTERMEQARLLGMSAERELALRAELATARQKAVADVAAWLRGEPWTSNFPLDTEECEYIATALETGEWEK